MSARNVDAASDKVMADRAALTQLVAERQAAGERAVFTNGVFDLLHLGHVRYLQQARALGDLLIVGLNSDDSTRRLKGPRRPLTPQDERAALLAALTAVDYVTIFDEDTAQELLAALRPAIYVKGGDYAGGVQAAQGQDILIDPGNLRRIVAGEIPYDPALASIPDLADLPQRLPEARTVASYGGSLALLAYLPGHSTSELIARIVARYAQDAQEGATSPLPD